MAWTNAGTTHYHSQLGLPDKGSAIKELGFYWVSLNTIPRLFGLKSQPQLLNLTPKCHGKQSRPYQVIEVHIRLLKSISICFLNILSIIVSQCLGHKDCDVVYFGIFKNVSGITLNLDGSGGRQDGWILPHPRPEKVGYLYVYVSDNLNERQNPQRGSISPTPSPLCIAQG